MKDTIFDFIFEYLPLLLILVIVPLVIFGSNSYVRYQCMNYQRVTGIDVYYANFDTCYIKTASGFQRWDEYKFRAATNETRGASK